MLLFFLKDALETAKKIEQTQMGDIDTEMRDVDKLKQTKSFLKGKMDELEENVNAARKDVGSVSKELQAANKAINQLEVYVLFFAKIFLNVIGISRTNNL